ncbi:hypothetical protein MKW98_007910, partial [Papaver atlanticum]
MIDAVISVLDHIQGDDLHVSCYYIDTNLNAYAISTAQMYSNTPADFDFKLESLAQGFESLSEFAEHLASSVDIVFPVIHGRFGEDGGIQVCMMDVWKIVPVLMICESIRHDRFVHVDVVKANANPSPVVQVSTIVCENCEGNGAVSCSQCEGNGVNSVDHFDRRFKAGGLGWLC